MTSSKLLSGCCDAVSSVIVIGGGPAGHAVATTVARAGGHVTLIEGERLGGNCVHTTCIPSGLMLGVASAFLDGQELSVAGVFDMSEDLRLGRAGVRRDALVNRLAKGMSVSLTTAGVRVMEGIGRLEGPGHVLVTTADGVEALEADHVVLATGARWEPPEIEGVLRDRVTTPDAVLQLASAPASALVLGGGPASTAFTVESAVLLAASGTEVAYRPIGCRIVPTLETDVDDALRASLEAIGIDCSGQVDPSDVELVVAPDGRRPSISGLGLETVLSGSADHVPVDRHGCAGDRLWACGDVTGTSMTTAAALHSARVVAANITGTAAVLRLGAVPHALHTVPETGWVGLSSAAAAAAGHDVLTAAVDVSWSARGTTAGGREGLVVLVAEPELGQVLGVHASGPGAMEAVTFGATAMQNELTVDDVACSVHWHPSGAELVVEAALQLQ